MSKDIPDWIWSAYYRGVSPETIMEYETKGILPKSREPIFCDEVILDEVGCYNDDGELLPECEEFLLECKYDLKEGVINVHKEYEGAKGYGDCIIYVNPDTVTSCINDIWCVAEQDNFTKENYGKTFVICCPKMGYKDCFD